MLVATKMHPGFSRRQSVAYCEIDAGEAQKPKKPREKAEKGEGELRHNGTPRDKAPQGKS